MIKKKNCTYKLRFVSQITHLKCILYSENCILTTILMKERKFKKKLDINIILRMN